jgi:hypothetical protein
MGSAGGQVYEKATIQTSGPFLFVDERLGDNALVDNTREVAD